MYSVLNTLSRIIWRVIIISIVYTLWTVIHRYFSNIRTLKRWRKKLKVELGGIFKEHYKENEENIEENLIEVYVVIVV